MGRRAQAVSSIARALFYNSQIYAVPQGVHPEWRVLMLDECVSHRPFEEHWIKHYTARQWFRQRTNGKRSKRRITDQLILSEAYQYNFVSVSDDLDFLDLTLAGIQHAGTIILIDKIEEGEQINSKQKMLLTVTALASHIELLDRNGIVLARMDETYRFWTAGIEETGKKEYHLYGPYKNGNYDYQVHSQEENLAHKKARRLLFSRFPWKITPSPQL